MGGAISFPRFTEEDIQEKVKINFEDGNTRRSMVFFDDKLVEAMAAPWKDALVVKILGLSFDFTAMHEKLKSI